VMVETSFRSAISSEILRMMAALSGSASASVIFMVLPPKNELKIQEALPGSHPPLMNLFYTLLKQQSIQSYKLFSY